MALNLDKLPDRNPTGLPKPGYYLFKITKSVMTACQDVTKPEYISLTFALRNSQGKNCGNIYDRITESQHEIALYKLGRLLKATDVSIKGSLNLKDLAKVLPNREGVLELTHNEKDPAKPRAEVKVFGSECFWPSSEFTTLIKNSTTSEDDTIIEPEVAVPFDLEAMSLAEESKEPDEVQDIIDSVESESEY